MAVRGGIHHHGRADHDSEQIYRSDESMITVTPDRECDAPSFSCEFSATLSSVGSQLTRTVLATTWRLQRRLPENQNQNNNDDKQAKSTADIHSSPVRGSPGDPVRCFSGLRPSRLRSLMFSWTPRGMPDWPLAKRGTGRLDPDLAGPSAGVASGRSPGPDQKRVQGAIFCSSRVERGASRSL